MKAIKIKDVIVRADRIDYVEIRPGCSEDYAEMEIRFRGCDYKIIQYCGLENNRAEAEFDMKRLLAAMNGENYEN